MSAQKIMLYAGLFLAGGVIGYLIGNLTSSSSDERASPAVTQSESSPEVIAAADSVKLATALAEGTDSVNQETQPAPVKPIDPAQPANNTLLTSSDNVCFTSDEDMSLQLTLMAEQMERDSIMYNNREPEKLQDCSGIFHRVVQFVQSKCVNFDYPAPNTARDSRSLSRWYHEQDNLILIEDPLASKDLIRPGAVMFFGGTGKSFQNLTFEQVTAPYPNGLVEHIGVVTEVTRDDEGHIKGYVMMHGRRPGVTAQRSHYHSVEPPRLGYPPLGNWNQQWIAVAYIMTPKST